MRKVVSGLLLAGLFVMMFFSPGAAFAYEEPQPEGQLITEKSYIGLAYFQVWQHSDGRWQDTDQDGTPDKPGQVKSWDFEMPGSLESLTSNWNLTGVRVRFLSRDEWDETTYQSYRGYKGLPFDIFDKQILKYSAAQCKEGKVWAEEHFPTYTLRYDGIRLATEPGVSDEEAAKEYAMDLKRPEYRSFVQSLGIPMSLPSGASFSKMAAGYIYWVPYIVEVWGVPKQEIPDLYVKSLDPNTSEIQPGQKYSGTVVYGLKNTVKQPFQAKLELTHNGWGVSGVNNEIIIFNPGEEKSFSFTFTGQNDDSLLIAKIRPVEVNEDSNWSNNSKQVRVPVHRVVSSGPGSLTFQAVSQTGKYTRSPGTAKWTDWVTATLKPAAPVPPRGSLDWWEITDAKLTYPKKNPDFTFGCPLSSKGTRTVSMTPNGHVATVKFQEDWGMDGASIYCILTKELMAEKPKEYPITAKYQIKYQYSWTECDDEGNCWTETRTATTSGSITADLLVNGTGVDSRAQ